MCGFRIFGTHLPRSGARVMVNVFVRDVDLGVVDRLDARRLEIFADGFLFSVEPVGHRHDVGFPSAPRGHAKKRSRVHGWHSSC